MTVTIPGETAKEWFQANRGGCLHPVVSLKRGKHLNISAACLTCKGSTVVRNVFVKASDLIRPKIDWSKLGMLGDSMLPKGDPRLLP